MWKKFLIMDGTNQVELVLTELKPATPNVCWKVVWP